ncbi:MAG: ABC transporter permease, partial [Gemmatimonadales bacterium]
MSLSLTRVGRMVRKELVQMLRDPRMRLVIFVSPMIQLVVLGYAVSTDVRDVPVAVVDRDRTTESRELIDRLTASGYFRVVGLDPHQGIADAIELGTSLMGLEIPPGFSVDLKSGGGADVQVLLDGTDSNTGTIALGYLQGMIQRFARDFGGGQAGVVLLSRAWYNPDLESRVYNVPGVMGALLLLITMLLTALGVVREREIGTWEQLVVSPITPTELML